MSGKSFDPGRTKQKYREVSQKIAHVCAFQPSPTCSYSDHTYISGNKEKQEKKQIIILYISVVLPCIQQIPFLREFIRKWT